MDRSPIILWLISEPAAYITQQWMQPIIVYDFTSPMFTEEAEPLCVNPFDLLSSL